MEAFEEWLEKLPLQTLTDELKKDILQKHKADCEKAYSEEDVKLIVYAFQAAYDKPCYTTQVRYNHKMEEIRSTESLFPMQSFYEQYLKNYKK